MVICDWGTSNNSHVMPHLVSNLLTVEGILVMGEYPTMGIQITGVLAPNFSACPKLTALPIAYKTSVLLYKPDHYKPSPMNCVTYDGPFFYFMAGYQSGG